MFDGPFGGRCFLEGGKEVELGAALLVDVDVLVGGLGRVREDGGDGEADGGEKGVV